MRTPVCISHADCGHQKGELLVFVPAHLAVTTDSLDDTRFTECSVQSRVAIFLAMQAARGKPGYLQPWLDTMPTLEDFSAFPMNWPESGRTHLSSYAKEVLQVQMQKIDKDWTAVEQAQAAEDVDPDAFRLYWMIVNTRSFWWEYTSVDVKNADTCMALFPIAEFFNHTNTNAAVCILETRERDDF